MVEILTVVAIVGVLAALLVPTAGRMVDRSKYAKCASNLRQWGLGFQSFTVDNDGRLPTSFEVTGIGKTGWQEKIAPYLVGNAGVVDGQRETMRAKFECPSNNRIGTYPGIIYGANNYLRPSIYARAPLTAAALPDKRSNFLLLIENYTGEVWDTSPGTGTKVDYERHKMGKSHRANILFADFHVEGLTYQETLDRPVVLIP